LTSTFATVSTDIPSYEAIHGRMPSTYYRSLISDTFRLWDVTNYPFLTLRDTREISYRFESTDCISEVSWYVYSIEVNGNRWFRVGSRGQPARDASQHLRRRHRPESTATDCRSNYAREVHPIEFNRSRDNSELIPEANRPGDASATKSVEVNCNKCIIRECEGCQMRHQWDSISNLPIESIDNYRDDSMAHTPPWVASRAMLKPVLLQFAVDDSQFTTYRHIPQTKCTYRGSGRIYAIRTIHI